MTEGVKIRDIRITQHRLPLEPAFPASWDTKPRRNFDATIVQVRTDDGHVGFGSGDSMIGFESYKDLFIGQDPLDRERHFRVLSNISFHAGRCWPLDLALWDLTGKILQQPVWKLVGGKSRSIRAYASSGVLREPEEMLETARSFVEKGFAAMKIRFHREDWREDIRALEFVRKGIGNQLEIMVDCNQGWRMPWDTDDPWTLKDAIAVARELESLNVFWMEEPLHRGDREGMKRLRNLTSLRIAGGEMTRELHEFRDLVCDGCLDVVQPDAALVGGITGLIKVMNLCELHNVIFTPHTWTNGLGLLANAHLTAGAGNAPFMEFPYDPPQWSLDRRDFMMSNVLDADNEGFINLSDAPGFGTNLNEEVLKETLVG